MLKGKNATNATPLTQVYRQALCNYNHSVVNIRKYKTPLKLGLVVLILSCPWGLFLLCINKYTRQIGSGK